MNEYNSKANEAVACFDDGLNCAQAVLCTYCEEYGLGRANALQIARGFGAGMGKLQEICGAVTGAIMVLGLRHGGETSKDGSSKEQLYGLTREFAARFEKRNNSIICRELLNVDLINGDKAINSARVKSICPKMVKDATEILEEMREGLMANEEEIREHVRKQYSKAANKEAQGCCFGECGCNGTATDIPEVSQKLGYSESELSSVPPESNMGLGCGNPVAMASLRAGEVVLDLGSGGGFDCFIASRQVGDTGRVIGVDMTPDMITLARKNAAKGGYENVEFRLGEIEHLPVADHSVDVVISNCVINLSPAKEQVFKETYRVLKAGGRLMISDVVATAEIPDNIKRDLDMVSSCIGGAEHIDKISAMLQKAGYTDISIKLKENSNDIVRPWAPGTNIEDFIASANIEAVK